MEQLAIVDAVCKAALENLAEEIGTLLGQELSCADVQLRLVTKEGFFNQTERKKTALTRITVNGEHSGQAYLLTRIGTAINLGGTLIMLPEEMITEQAEEGKLEGELADAFGEVANIIAGVFTQSFVDKYPKTLRFIKDSVEELLPDRVDPASDQPFPPGNYHVSSCRLNAGEQDLGPLELVVPAALFDLEEQTVNEPEAAAATAEEAKGDPQPAVEAKLQDQETTPPEPAVRAKPPFAKAKKLIDTVFEATFSQVSEEIGALIGEELSAAELQLVMTSKEEFFSTYCLEQSTLTQIEVSGSRQGRGFLAIEVADAIILGGTMIMLPEEQIREQAESGDLDADVADAFGEVANILAGGLTQVFSERYPQAPRFVKGENELIVPTKVDPAADQPFPAGDYYLASCAMEMAGYELKRMQLLFPAELFDLYPDQSEQASAAARETAGGSAAGGTAAGGTAAGGTAAGGSAAGGSAAGGTAAGGSAAGGSAAGGSAAGGSAAGGSAAGGSVAGGSVAGDSVAGDSVAGGSASEPAAAQAASESPVVLIIHEQAAAAEPFTEILTSAGYAVKTLSFQDDIKASYKQHQVIGVFLLMSEVNEKGFATAIKLQSSGQPLPPMIFAGPEWTRSSVLRAVKYGARDILVLPASNDEIQEKVSQHILKAS